MRAHLTAARLAIVACLSAAYALGRMPTTSSMAENFKSAHIDQRRWERSISSMFPRPKIGIMRRPTDKMPRLPPILKTLYQFANSLGTSNVAFVYDAISSEYQTFNIFGTTGPDQFESDEWTIWQARLSMIRTNDPLGHGDLFEVSGSPLVQKPMQIKQLNRATNAFVESIAPPTEQDVYDFGFGPDDRLYMAAETGIYVYDEGARASISLR